MVMLNCSYTALKQAIGKDLSQEQLRDVLFDLGFELDGLIDDEVAIEVTAERLDVLSVQGMARAIRSFLDAKAPAGYTLLESNYKVRITKEVKKVRPHTVAAVVQNLQLDDELIKEIIDVQEKLHATLGRGRKRGAIGIYPLDAIKMPITFTAAKPKDIKFQPLEAKGEMTAKQIIEEHPTGKEYGHLLDGLALYPYFHDGNNEVLSVPPIINSEKTGRVTEDTTDIFIECSGHEQAVLDELLVYLTTMFDDMGGDVYSVIVEYDDGSTRKTPNLSTKKKVFHTSMISKYLGIDLDDKEIEKHLAQMMFQVVSKDKVKGDDILASEKLESVYKVAAPCYRFDLWHEIDILDDIARAYGYNNLPLTLPRVESIGSTLPLSDLRDELSNVLAGLGYLETYTFALSGKQEQIENMQLDHDDYVKVTNGNEVQTMLRTRLLPQQLTSLAINKKLGLPQQLFEGAYVVLPDASRDVKARNELHLCALKTDKKVSYTEIRQVMDATLASRGIKVTVENEGNHPSFLPGRVGTVKYGGKAIGVIGELHPQVLNNFGVDSPVACFEINLEPFIK